MAMYMAQRQQIREAGESHWSVESTASNGKTLDPSAVIMSTASKEEVRGSLVHVPVSHCPLDAWRPFRDSPRLACSAEATLGKRCVLGRQEKLWSRSWRT